MEDAVALLHRFEERVRGKPVSSIEQVVNGVLRPIVRIDAQASNVCRQGVGQQRKRIDAEGVQRAPKMFANRAHRLRIFNVLDKGPVLAAHSAYRLRRQSKHPSAALDIIAQAVTRHAQSPIEQLSGDPGYG